MRSPWCGLLLLAISALPAAGQAPTAAPWPALEEARGTSQCETSEWAQLIAQIKASDPEEHAKERIAAGDFSLKSARSLVLTSRQAILLRPLPVTPKDAPSASKPPAPDVARKKSESDAFVGVGFASSRQPTGVQCKLDVRPTEAFPIRYVENEALDIVPDAPIKWCARAVVVLAADYAKRFNRRVVGDQAYPHKDLCSVSADGSQQASTDVGKISDRPTPEMIPAQIADIATAARFGLTERVAKFIADGADGAQRDAFGFDALKWAVVRDYRPAFDLIMAANGKPDFCAALEAAMEHNRAEPAVLLVQRCPSQERRLRLLGPAVARGNADVVRALIDTAPRLFLPETHSETQAARHALSTAVSAGRVEIVRLLLDWVSGDMWLGLQQELVDSAARWRKPAVLKLLLERGADPGLALRLAVERKAHDVVRTLAHHGVDLNRALAPRLHDVTATSVAFDPLGRLANPTKRLADPPIFLALDPLMDFKMVDLLLELGADPNVRDASGRTPLMVAIASSQIYGRKGGAGWIERYVPAQLIPGQEDWAHRGVEPVRALLAKGADVALADPAGLTALHHAARSDYNVEIAEILIGHGAKVDAKDASGKTPLDHARETKLVRMPEALAAAGASKGSR